MADSGSPSPEPFQDSSDEEHEIMHLTSAQVVQKFQEAWINEKCAPEILPYQVEFVNCILDLINSMEENVRTLEVADLKRIIYQMDLERVQFILTSYLRTRLEKIENYVFFILKEELGRIEKNEERYLSNEELQFAKQYSQSIEQHFQNVLSFRPEITSNEWKENSVIPNINSFVFAKSSEDIEGLVIDDENVVDLKENSQIILPYGKIANLLKFNKVNLL